MQPESVKEPYVTVEEVAKHFSISVSTIRTWVKQGLIPRDTYIKVGNTYRFQLGAVIEALASAEAETKKPTIEAPGPGIVVKTNNVTLDDVLDDLDDDI